MKKAAVNKDIRGKVDELPTTSSIVKDPVGEVREAFQQLLDLTVRTRKPYWFALNWVDGSIVNEVGVTSAYSYGISCPMPITPFVTIDTIREGFDRSKIDQVAAMARLTKKEIATLLGVSERHLYNAAPKPLSALQSEHLANLKGLFAHGLQVFDGEEATFSEWLRTPKQALAVPQTGFPLILPPDYVQPTLTQLFAPVHEEATSQAIERNIAYTREQAAEQTRPVPTPLDILDTATGVALVNDILGRIDAGVFS